MQGLRDEARCWPGEEAQEGDEAYPRKDTLSRKGTSTELGDQKVMDKVSPYFVSLLQN